MPSLTLPLILPVLNRDYQGGGGGVLEIPTKDCQYMGGTYPSPLERLEISESLRPGPGAAVAAGAAGVSGDLCRREGLLG